MVVNLESVKSFRLRRAPSRTHPYGQQVELRRGLLLHKQGHVTPLSKFLPTPLNRTKD